MHLSEIATFIGAELFRDGPESAGLDRGGQDIRGLASLEEAEPGHLSFFADGRYKRALETTRATAVILAQQRPGLPFAQLIHPDPMMAFIRLVEHFYPSERPSEGIRPGAYVSPEAILAEGVVVEPTAVIEAGVRLGRRVVISAGCVIARGVEIGDDSFLHPRVVVMAGSCLGKRVIVHPGAVIGSDGYGYRWDGRQHRKVPQVGRVVIEDDVEIGANCTIDRATLGTTVIGAGTKLDNQVHVGHNVKVGRNCLLIAQVGISGSVKIGEGAVLAGQAGVADHSEIGAGAVVVGQSGVHGRVRPGAIVAGAPIMPHEVWRKVSAALPRLPELLKRVRKLEHDRGGVG